MHTAKPGSVSPDMPPSTAKEPLRNYIKDDVKGSDAEGLSKPDEHVWT